MSNTDKERRNRSEQEWRAIMANYESSGLSQTAYCHKEGIGASTFQKWRRRFRGAKGSFISVPAPLPEGSDYQLEIELPSGTIVRIK